MKLAFDFTLDDLVDAAERAGDRSHTITGMRSQARLVVSIVAAVVVWLIIPGTWGLVAAGLAAALGWYLYPGDLKKLHRKKLRQFFKEEFGGEGPFRCEVELAPEGLVTVQAGARSLREWPTITAVNDTPEAVEIVARASGSVLVRNSAFASPAERAEFISLARRHANLGDRK